MVEYYMDNYIALFQITLIQALMYDSKVERLIDQHCLQQYYYCIGQR